MAPWNTTGTPGAAVLVIRHGKVVHSKGYGMANLDERRPITPGTSFLLASVTKQFTAMAIMILSEEGKLSYDDTLASFFPEFPAYACRITVRTLLNHTAALPEYNTLLVEAGLVRKSDYGIARNLRTDGFEPTVHDVLRILATQKEPRFAAGAKYAYRLRATGSYSGEGIGTAVCHVPGTADFRAVPHEALSTLRRNTAGYPGPGDQVSKGERAICRS